MLGHELNHGEHRDVLTANVWDELAELDGRHGRRPGPSAHSIEQGLCRGQESDADAAGARRAHAAGYRADGLRQWLLELRSSAGRRQQTAEARRHPDASDHPSDAERIAALGAQIVREHLEAPPRGSR